MKCGETFRTRTSLDMKWSKEYCELVSHCRSDCRKKTKSSSLYNGKVDQRQCSVLLEKVFLPLDLVNIDLGDFILDHVNEYLTKVESNVIVKSLLDPVLSFDKRSNTSGSDSDCSFEYFYFDNSSVISCSDDSDISSVKSHVNTCNSGLNREVVKDEKVQSKPSKKILYSRDEQNSLPDNSFQGNILKEPTFNETLKPTRITRQSVINYGTTASSNCGKYNTGPSIHVGKTKDNTQFEQISTAEIIAKRFSCGLCPYSVDSKARLKRHIESVHLKLKPFKCEHCNKSFTSVPVLRNHIRSFHLEKKPFQYSDCQKVFSEIGSVINNIDYEHKKKRSFKCRQCNFKSEPGLSVKKHISLVHRIDKPFQCAHCFYSSSLRTSLVSHINSVHKKLKPFKCPHCKYCSSQSTHLKTHITSVHEKQKPFKCQLCKYATTQSSHLNTHVRLIHTKEKPFKCPHCDYAAGLRHYLKTHIIAIHKKEKPHKCPFCPHVCSQKGSLNAHVKRLHSENKKTNLGIKEN